MRTTTKTLLAASAVAWALAACGGSSSNAPEPLDYEFDDRHIARVSTADKRAVLDAQSDYAAAVMERANAETQLEDVETTLRVAKNEREQAALQASSAQSEMEAADRSSDQNRIEQATINLDAAELALRAAEARVEYVERHQEALEAYYIFRAESAYAQQARYEYAKARVAEAHGIRPEGFDYAAYEEQARTRARLAKEAESAARSARRQAEDMRDNWENLVRRTHPGASEDGGDETSAR